MGLVPTGYSDLSRTILGSAYAASVYKWVGERGPDDPFTATEVHLATRIAPNAVGNTLKKLAEAAMPLIERIDVPRHYLGRPYRRIEHDLWAPLLELSVTILENEVDWPALDNVRNIRDLY